MRNSTRDLPGQLDLFGNDYRPAAVRRIDRGRVWEAYADCLTLEQALAQLPDIPAEAVREQWPACCPGTPDSRLDRRRVMEAVEEHGAAWALDYYGSAMSPDDLPWLRETVAKFSERT